MTIEEKLRTEMKEDLMELLRHECSLDEALVNLEDKYYGMIEYILSEFYHGEQIKGDNIMDFEQFFNDLLNSEELDDFKKSVNKEKQLYLMKDFPNNEYYYLKLSDESKNLLEWLIDEVGLLDACLFITEEIDALEF